MTQPPSASDRAAGSAQATATASPWETHGRLWGTLAVLAALVPFAGVFTPDSVFYIRDLSMCFWDRHLWLRRSLLSGEWPLWDPYLAAGQSAVADALHQMFLLPVLAVRLFGTEVVGFNLWVALPFPLAGLGAFLFFRSRFSPSAAALGAMTFAASGPIVSTGNFPNLSWSVAALPWVLRAADRCGGTRPRRHVSMLALAFAFQAAAGEPVTLAATAVLALAMSLVVGPPGAEVPHRRARATRTLTVLCGLGLGALIASVQLLPMASAVHDSSRPFIRTKDFWSFHPLMLAEALSPHFFGNFFQAPRLDGVPWVKTLNSGREPFFYSVYIGPAVLALALFGAVAGWRRRWVGFWSAVGAVGLLAAFGGHTPIYPFVRTYLPVLGSFRYPVKYLVICVIALAALVAASWEALWLEERRRTVPGRYRAARYAGVLLPLAIGLGACLLWVASLYEWRSAARWFYDLAVAVGVPGPEDAAAFLLRSAGDALWKVALLAIAVALFMAVAPSRRPEARVARPALYAAVVLDLLYAASGLNPTCRVELLEAPFWANVMQAHPESRFYLGGKMQGMIVEHDRDAPSGFMVPPELPLMVRRAIFARHTLLFPAGVGAREMLSYDLPVLWPRVFELTHAHFARETADGRERFLSRAAVRYRILPPAEGRGRPAISAGAFVGVEVHDFGAGLTRAYVVPRAVAVSDQSAQMAAMFGSSFDDRRSVMIAREPSPAEGNPSAPVEPGARIVRESANRVTIEAGTGPAGGFLVLLDTYSPDWSVVVDGQPGTLYPANLLFRAVHLAPGRHSVEFRYRPRLFLLGAALSVAGLLGAAIVGLRLRGSDRS